MSEYSKSHERDEVRKIKRGIIDSILALVFCWVPIVGLILSIVGYLRQAVRLTEEHTKKHKTGLVLSIVALVVCVSVFLFECYYYSRHPDVLTTGPRSFLEKISGQSLSGGDDYDYDDVEVDESEPEEEDDEYYTDEDEEDEEYYDDYEDEEYDNDFDDSMLAGFDEDEDEEEEPAGNELFQTVYGNHFGR